MSRFFSAKFERLAPYEPGEQPKDMSYIKLNTNESPFNPSKSVAEAALREAGKLQLYSDPEIADVCNAVAKLYNLKPTETIATNGSDEALNFAFAAFGDGEHPFVFPDISYGFYPVFANLNGIPYEEIPLKEDFTVGFEDYCGIGKNIAIANPNAPTGIAMPLWQIEQIVKTNPDNIVIIDEAYVDFGAQSAAALISKYDNLIITQTFSKSRSMAGARLGFALACEDVIKDLNVIRFSTNPYNVNSMSIACGAAALRDNQYYMDNCKIIIQNREYAKRELEKRGFEVLDSKANFIFAKSSTIGGKILYEKLKKSGILIRHFEKERINDYVRITVGTMEQMKIFIKTVDKILEEAI